MDTTATTIARHYAPHSIEIVGYTLLLTVILELYSMDMVRHLLSTARLNHRETKNNDKNTTTPSDDATGSSPHNNSSTYSKKQLVFYGQAIALNLINHVGLGIPSYVIAGHWFCTDHELQVVEQWWKILSILFLHAVMYYKIHEWMHRYPKLYKIHRFHHRFNTYITPVAANAVTPTEYLFAYLLPFAIAMAITKPDTYSIRMALSISSFLNLIVHTPTFESFSQRFVPLWMVATHDHMEHHRKLTVKYASPTFSIDYLVQYANTIISGSSQTKKDKDT